MRKAGFVKVGYGVESGSPRVLKEIKKGITIEQIVDAFEKTKKAGIKTEAYIMIGHLTETREDFEMTLRLIKKIGPQITVVSIVTPYPGTELFDVYRERGYLREDVEWGDFILFSKKVPWRTEHFAGNELVRMRDGIMRKLYLSPRYIARRIMDIKGFDDLRYYVKSGFVVLKFLMSPKS